MLYFPNCLGEIRRIVRKEQNMILEATCPSQHNMLHHRCWIEAESARVWNIHNCKLDKTIFAILMYYIKIVNGRKHLLVFKAEFCKSFALKSAKQYINHLVSRIPSPLSSSSLFWENWTRGGSLIWKYERQGRPTMSHNLLAKKSPKFPFSTIIYFSCQQREKGLIVFLCHLENWASVTIIKTIVFFSFYVCNLT